MIRNLQYERWQLQSGFSQVYDGAFFRFHKQGEFFTFKKSLSS